MNQSQKRSFFRRLDRLSQHLEEEDSLSNDATQLAEGAEPCTASDVLSQVEVVEELTEPREESAAAAGVEEQSACTEGEKAVHAIPKSANSGVDEVDIDIGTKADSGENEVEPAALSERSVLRGSRSGYKIDTSIPAAVDSSPQLCPLITSDKNADLTATNRDTASSKGQAKCKISGMANTGVLELGNDDDSLDHIPPVSEQLQLLANSQSTTSAVDVEVSHALPGDVLGSSLGVAGRSIHSPTVIERVKRGNKMRSPASDTSSRSPESPTTSTRVASSRRRSRHHVPSASIRTISVADTADSTPATGSRSSRDSSVSQQLPQPQDESSLFREFRLLFVAGRSLTERRIAILSAAVEKRGGRAVRSLADDPTHIVADVKRSESDSRSLVVSWWEKSRKRRTVRRSGVEIGSVKEDPDSVSALERSNARFVRLDWVIDCQREKLRLPPDDYDVGRTNSQEQEFQVKRAWESGPRRHEESRNHNNAGTTEGDKKRRRTAVFAGLSSLTSLGMMGATSATTHHPGQSASTLVSIDAVNVSEPTFDTKDSKRLEKRLGKMPANTVGGVMTASTSSPSKGGKTAKGKGKISPNDEGADGGGNEWMDEIDLISAKQQLLKMKRMPGKRTDADIRMSYACQQKRKVDGTSSADGGSKTSANERIVSQLKEMKDLYADIGDEWRELAYNKALSAISGLHEPISSGEHARKLLGIGSGVAAKIDEIITYGTIQKFANLSRDERVCAVRQFTKIWGVGRVTARKWVQQGYRTLDDLRVNVQLNADQEIGLRYYDDLQQRIPRDEIVRVGEVIRAEIDKIRPAMQMEIVGSFRRGKPACGDMDFLITDPECSVPDRRFMYQLLDALRKCGLLVADLRWHESGRGRDHADVAGASPGGMENVSSDIGALYRDMEEEREAKPHEHLLTQTYMGVCRLSKDLPHRRIDIKLYSIDEHAFAVMYFTGSAYFNRSMRYYARQHGWTLSDHGLYPVTRDGRGLRVHEGDGIPCKDEKEIFQTLGLEYVAPEDRNPA